MKGRARIYPTVSSFGESADPFLDFDLHIRKIGPDRMRPRDRDLPRDRNAQEDKKAEDNAEGISLAEIAEVAGVGHGS